MGEDLLISMYLLHLGLYRRHAEALERLGHCLFSWLGLFPICVAGKCRIKHSIGGVMQYLVKLQLSSSARPTSPKEGIEFIEKVIFPTLELCKKLQETKKILAGGPVSGAVALMLIVNAESAQELDDIITSLPIWPRLETQVIPLTTFDGRAQSLLSRLKELKAQVLEIEKPTPGKGR